LLNRDTEFSEGIYVANQYTTMSGFKYHNHITASFRDSRTVVFNPNADIRRTGPHYVQPFLRNIASWIKPKFSRLYFRDSNFFRELFLYHYCIRQLSSKWTKCSALFYSANKPGPMSCVEHHFSINLINRNCGRWIFISVADIRGAGAYYI
jgi:hypothetical protein